MAHAKILYWLLPAIWGAAYPARAEIIAHIDVGVADEAAVFGHGWWRTEQNPERTFRWIRFHLEADIWLTLSQDPGEAEVELLAAPYYHPRRQQRLALYVNDRFVAEWTFPRSEKWRFQPLRAHIRSGILRPGRNRLILRAGYLGERGYAVAVDRITLWQIRADPR